MMEFASNHAIGCIGDVSVIARPRVRPRCDAVVPTKRPAAPTELGSESEGSPGKPWEAGADGLILDSRGGATGAAPLIFREHISVPTIAALPRARRHLDLLGRQDVPLIITGD